MANTTPTAPSSSSANLQAVFETSLKRYEKETKKSLLTLPLMAQLQACNSPADTLTILRSRAANFEQTMDADDKFIKWLDPIVNVLSASSSVISAGVGLVFSPANVIFAGAGVLLSAAQGFSVSHDELVMIFDKIESFFKRLEEHAKVQMTDTMKGIMIKIMVEVLEVFAIMTKEIKQNRAKRFFKKFFKTLIGIKGIEEALNKLDELTQEEVELAIVQIQTVTKQIQEGVNQLIDDEKEKEARAEEERRRQMIEDRRRRVREDEAWLSPPDPSTDQNTASKSQHDGTAKWFFEGDISKDWKSKSSTQPLLWIHGKPGSGKSVLCSAIIQDIMELQKAGQATVAYFYFGFKDTQKQDLRNALASLLTQLSAHSDSYCDILCHVHKAHSNGKYTPSNKTMITCLNDMLALPGQGPVYIILDALDECPNISGIPTTERGEVLKFLKDLVGAQLSNLRICVTSLLEIDIRAALEPLAFRQLSIHDQIGQKKDIEDYIRFAVYAKSNTAMGRRWRGSDKELVIDTLSDKADGMFRWVFCQLEVLQHCLPTAILQALSELPKTLDETYQRVLNEIGMVDRDLTHRLLQCLTMAIRPLRVKELAEILALDFTVADGATPELKEDHRSENPEEAVLSICSSLIMIAGTGQSRVIQFSHFSVKEFLTSSRLRDFQGEDYIGDEPAHTTLAQACLGTLLQLDGRLGNLQVDHSFPFARYASQHWVEHAQFGKVSSQIEDGLQRLFDSTNPYFVTWIRLNNMDDHWAQFGNPSAARGLPLYYASLFGFRDLAEHIIKAHPEQVNAKSGLNHCPLAAALYKGHFDVAELLLQNGASINVTGHGDQTPLQAASVDGRSDIARWLLDNGADTQSQRDDHAAPIHLATANGHLEVIKTLLEHKVNIDSVDKDGRTPLHLASSSGNAEIVRLLLDMGADTSAVDKDGRTSLTLAKTIEVMRLLDHGPSLDEEGRSTEGGIIENGEV